MNSVVSVSVLTAAAMVGLFLGGCGPEPKSQACRVDHDCKASIGEAAYCLRSHCVECVSNASCGRDRLCVDGRCATP